MQEGWKKVIITTKTSHDVYMKSERLSKNM